MALALAVPAVFFFVVFAAIAILVNALIIHWLSKVFGFALCSFIRALEVSALVGVVNFSISVGIFFIEFESYFVDSALVVAVIASTYGFAKWIYSEAPRKTFYFSLAVFALDLAVGILVGGLIILLFNLLSIPFF